MAIYIGPAGSEGLTVRSEWYTADAHGRVDLPPGDDVHEEAARWYYRPATDAEVSLMLPEPEPEPVKRRGRPPHAQ